MSNGYIAGPGEADGSLLLVTTGRMIPADLLAFHPEIEKLLAEIEVKGWKYLYIETIGTSIAELSLSKVPFKITPSQIRPVNYESGRGVPAPPPDNILELTLGRRLPRIKSIPEVKLFKVNICSENFPRAATVDLSRNEVTYLHDPFWKWEPGSESDAKKLSSAKEVYEIASWLIDEKKFKLTGDVTEERYGELSYRFKKILGVS